MTAPAFKGNRFYFDSNSQTHMPVIDHFTTRVQIPRGRKVTPGRFAPSFAPLVYSLDDKNNLEIRG